MNQRFALRALALATALASLGLTLPVHAASFVPGDLIKSPGFDAVYYYGQNSKRYVFPNLKTYQTWYSDFGSVKEIPLADLQDIPLGGNATYRPGVKLVKITTDPKVYAVGAGGTLRWIETEQAAKDLYGANWNTNVDDIADAFFVNYKVGEPIVAATQFSPSGEMARASTINADKQLGTNGPPAVTISSDKTSVAAGSTVTLTINATFQGSGSLQNIVIKQNGSVSKYCSSNPCVIQSATLAAGTSNAFTAEVTDTNGFTGKSEPVTVTVPSMNYGY